MADLPLTVYQVFTPSVPAKEAFVDRPKSTNRLVEALRTPGKQVILYGHSGSGKSTLIERKLFEVYENHITTSCVTGMSFEAVLLDAFDQLDPYYLAASKVSTSRSISAEILSQWATVSAAKSNVKDFESNRILPPQLTVQNLSRFAGAAKACWVLEDFHKLDPAEKIKLAQAMKMFMDMAKTYPEIKTVAVGAVGTAREVIKYDVEMRNRVAEIEVELMERDELQKIIELGASKLNVKFPAAIARTIVAFSNGLPSVCHQLCLNTCIAAGVEVTAASTVLLSKENFDAAVREYVETCSDSIRDRFDKGCRIVRTRKNDNYGLILEALCSFELDGAVIGELSKKILNLDKDYKSNNVGRYLKALQTEAKGAILRVDSSSGKFSFADPFIRSYALAYFESRKRSASRSLRIDASELLTAVMDAIDRASRLLAEDKKLRGASGLKAKASGV